MPPHKIAIIGIGRLGSQLATETYPNATITAASTRNPKTRRSLAQRLPNALITHNPAEAAQHADTVFITTSDATIRQVCDAIPWQPHHRVAHFSGVLTTDALRSAAEAGASTAAFHPLQTFTQRNPPDALRNIAFAVDCDEPEFDRWLRALANHWNSRSFRIHGDAAHAAYHASAVLACGLLTGLVGVAASLWEAAGIDRDQAVEMLAPMLRTTADAIARDGIPEAISGPYIRGDVETIRRHLDITAQIDPEISRAYAAVAIAQLPIANEKAQLPPATVETIKSALERHLDRLHSELRASP